MQQSLHAGVSLVAKGSPDSSISFISVSSFSSIMTTSSGDFQGWMSMSSVSPDSLEEIIQILTMLYPVRLDSCFIQQIHQYPDTHVYF